MASIEQRGLGTRGRPVDLVEQHDVVEERTRSEGPLALAGIEHGHARHVARQEVDRPLDAGEAPADRAGDGLGEQRLAEPGRVLDQHVPAGQEGGDAQADRVGLVEDDAAEVLLEGRREARRLPELVGERHQGVFRPLRPVP
jgi:hypothetical protein